MSTPSVLIILIAASELSSPATTGLLYATRETLGSATILRIETFSATSEAPLPTRPDMNLAYVSVTWQGSSHEQARIVGRQPGATEDAERILSFGSADPEEERGRSVGFVIASLFAGLGNSSLSKPAQPPEPLPPSRLAPTPAEHRFAFSLAAVGAYPQGASSFGAYFDATRLVGHDFNLGLYFDARFGAIPSAQASTRWLSLGVVGRLDVLSLTRRVRISTVIHVGARQLSVTHLSEDDVVPDERQAYLALGSLALRLSMDLAQSAAVYADAGVEAQTGKARVNVHGGTAAIIPAVFGTVGLGVMARF